MAQAKLKKHRHVWPIDPSSARAPDGWPGWPAGNQFALVLSHDVDTRRGYQNVLKLADLEEQVGFRSQFNFVPERYGKVEISLVKELKRRGFGIGVHGLKHDGKLFRSREIFDKRASLINAYLKEWDTKGFTAPSMIRNHAWMSELEADYCVSTFDTDPFEPQSEGAGTIFPYWVRSPSSRRRFLELPYTLVQDFTLFVILGETKIDLWTRKLDWIAGQGGMALLNSHPDYMNLMDSPCRSEEYPVGRYRDFLEYLKANYQGRYWSALPSQIWDFWSSMPVNLGPVSKTGLALTDRLD